MSSLSKDEKFQRNMQLLAGASVLQNEQIKSGLKEVDKVVNQTNQMQHQLLNIQKNMQSVQYEQLEEQKKTNALIEMQHRKEELKSIEIERSKVVKQLIFEISKELSSLDEKNKFNQVSVLVELTTQIKIHSISPDLVDNLTDKQFVDDVIENIKTRIKLLSTDANTELFEFHKILTEANKLIIKLPEIKSQVYDVNSIDQITQRAKSYKNDISRKFGKRNFRLEVRDFINSYYCGEGLIVDYESYKFKTFMGFIITVTLLWMMLFDRETGQFNYTYTQWSAHIVVILFVIASIVLLKQLISPFAKNKLKRVYVRELENLITRYNDEKATLSSENAKVDKVMLKISNLNNKYNELRKKNTELLEAYPADLIVNSVDIMSQ